MFQLQRPLRNGESENDKGDLTPGDIGMARAAYKCEGPAPDTSSSDSNSNGNTADNSANTGGQSNAGLQHAGQECWYRCRRAQGPCSYCGTGMCCRYGWDDTANGCNGTIGVKGG